MSQKAKLTWRQWPALKPLKTLIRGFLPRVSWTNPERMHTVRLAAAVEDALADYPLAHFGSCVDFGCGDRPYGTLLQRVCRQTTGVDVGCNPEADCIILPGEPLPFPDGSFDLVTSFQVLEHVRDYPQYLWESARVCRKGGILLLSVPSVWPFHPHPTDYRRWMLPGIINDLDSVGFRTVRNWPILNPVSSSIQFFLSVCRYSYWTRNWYSKAVVKSVAVLGNATIGITERCFRSTLAMGAGDYLLKCERV